MWVVWVIGRAVVCVDAALRFALQCVVRDFAFVSFVSFVSCYFETERDKRDDRDGSEVGYQSALSRPCVVRDFAVVSFVSFVSRISCYFETRGTRETRETRARTVIRVGCRCLALCTAVQINDVCAYPLYLSYPLYPFYPPTARHCHNK